MTSRALSAPLIQRLLPVRNDSLRILLQIAVGVTFLALMAQIRFEIGPVPITGQTLGVLLIGAAYGAGLGSLTMVSYLLVGGLGIGVFSGWGSGWSVLTGITGGYLFGFVLAGAVVGFLAQRGWDRNFGLTALAMLIGNLLIYLPGLLWMTRFAPDWPTALQWGLIPFIPGDLLKLLIAAAALPLAWRLLGHRKA